MSRSYDSEEDLPLQTHPRRGAMPPPAPARQTSQDAATGRLPAQSGSRQPPFPSAPLYQVDPGYMYPASTQHTAAPPIEADIPPRQFQRSRSPEASDPASPVDLSYGGGGEYPAVGAQGPTRSSPLRERIRFKTPTIPSRRSRSGSPPIYLDYSSRRPSNTRHAYFESPPDSDDDNGASTLYSYTPSRGAGSRFLSKRGSASGHSGDEGLSDDGAQPESEPPAGVSPPIAYHVFESHYTRDGIFGGPHAAELSAVSDTKVKYQPLFRWL